MAAESSSGGCADGSPSSRPCLAIRPSRGTGPAGPSGWRSGAPARPSPRPRPGPAWAGLGPLRGVAVVHQPPVDEVHQPLRRLVLHRDLLLLERPQLLRQPVGTSCPGHSEPVKCPCGFTSSPAPCRCHSRITAARVSCASCGNVSPLPAMYTTDACGPVRRAEAVGAGLHPEAAQLVGGPVRTDGVVVGDVGVVLLLVVQMPLLDAAQQRRALIVRLRCVRAPEPVNCDSGQSTRREAASGVLA